jgi:hypothetical protein
MIFNKYNDLKYLAKDKGIGAYHISQTIGLYHPLDGMTNLKYRLLHFLTPNKKNL